MEGGCLPYGKRPHSRNGFLYPPGRQKRTAALQAAGLTGALFPQKIPRDIHWRTRPYRPKVSGCKRNAAKRHAASNAMVVQMPYTVAFAIARRFSASPSGILP